MIRQAMPHGIAVLAPESGQRRGSDPARRLKVMPEPIRG